MRSPPCRPDRCRRPIARRKTDESAAGGIWPPGHFSCLPSVAHRRRRAAVPAYSAFAEVSNIRQCAMVSLRRYEPPWLTRAPSIPQRAPPRPRQPWRPAPYSFSCVASASPPARPGAGARPTGRGRSCDTSPAGEPGASRKSCGCVALAPASARPAGSKPRSGRRRASGSRRWPTTSADYFSSTHTGAWSLAPSSPRTSRSMPAPFSRRASVFDKRMWSSRRPASRGQRFRR